MRATDAQLTRLQTLAADRNWFDFAAGADAVADVVYNAGHQGERNIDPVTADEASGAIAWLLSPHENGASHSRRRAGSSRPCRRPDQLPGH